MRICKGLELLGIMSHGLSEPRHEKEPGLGAKYLIRLVAGTRSQRYLHLDLAIL